MRWIVLLLVIANLGVAGWFLSKGRAPDAVVQPPADMGADNSIALVSEVSPQELAQRSTAQQREAAPKQPKPAVTAPETPVAGEALCTMVGPFPEAYQGEDVAQRLRALEVDADSREIEMQGQMRYWVYLSPLGSRREAFRKLRELQAAGIDSYVIPKGSLENGISFGIFSEIERAQSLKAELNEQGFAAEFREEPQTYLEHWVVFAGGDEGQLAADFWQQLQLDYPEIDRRQNLCKEIVDAGSED